MKKKTSNAAEHFNAFWNATNNVPRISEEKFRKIQKLNLSEVFRLRARQWFHFFEPQSRQKTEINFQLLEALEKRKTTRDFHNAPLAQKEVTDLLAPCLASIQDRMGVPSAGALYPIDAYVVCLKSVDMDAGIYYWRAGSQNLIFLRPLPENINLAKNYASEVSDHVSVILFLVARVDAILEKYGLRSFRLLFLEAGHFSQSLWLLATALKIDFLIRDDFYDDEVSRYLALNPCQQRTLTSIMLSGAAKRP